jgi:predicted porin
LGSTKWTAVVFLALFSSAPGVNAAAGDTNPDPIVGPNLLFSGFGTLGLAHSTEKQADFTSSVFKPTGAGYSRAWSGNVDSRLGLQLTAEVDAKFSAVIQVITEQNYDGSYSPHVEWANVKYAFTSDASVRLGRIAMTTFLVGDYRKVAYSLPWVRLPADVFNIMPVTNNDGVDATYRAHFGEITNTVQGVYGSDKVNTPANPVPTVAAHTWGVFDTLENGPLSLRGSYLTSNVEIGATKPLLDGFRQFGPAGVAIADKYNLDDKRVSLLSFGASYDPGNWFVMAEWAKRTSDSFLGNATAWYASYGYRFGTLTPYALYSQSRKLSNNSDPGLDLTTLPPFLTGSAAELNGGLTALLQPTTATTVSVGSRWDFARSIAFKLQYDHFSLTANSTGPLTNLQSAFLPGGKVNVLSVTVDFVF